MFIVVNLQSQRFSKLTDDQDLDLDSESRDTTPSSLESSQDDDEIVSQDGFDAVLKDTLEDDEGDEDLFSLPEESAMHVMEVTNQLNNNKYFHYNRFLKGFSVRNQTLSVRPLRS